ESSSHMSASRRALRRLDKSRCGSVAKQDDVDSLPERANPSDPTMSQLPLRSIPLGKTGPHVFPVGLGCMGMSGMYGPAEDGESVATIRHAIDRGVTLLDTGDFYGMGHNELLIRRGIEGVRGKVQLS